MQRLGDKIGFSLLFLLITGGIFGCASVTEDSSTNIPRMTIEELVHRLDEPDLVILDVRLPSDQQKSRLKIKGAYQENPNVFSGWADKYPKTSVIVLYCS